MRLHTLTLSAFGSFGGTESIDFDRLADDGLFLLHGPTGAGKTTVLDAVSFALFGTVPGVRPAGDNLRSHHAAPATATEVRLEVTLDARRYRIVRRPRQQRPKLRGEGTREHPASATIEELVAGTWLSRASRPTEADPFLQEHLHMGADQFHQVVMLPQGEFARFLRAGADERRRALEDLFGTHRFSEVERWLRARADAARLVVQRSDEQVRRALVAAATVAGPDTEAFVDEQPLTEAPGWLSTLLAAVEQRADAAAACERAGRRRHEQARATLTEAIARADRQQRHARAVAAHQQLAAAEELQQTRRTARDAARARAASVLPLIDQLDRATAERATAQQRVERDHAALAAVDPELAEAAAESRSGAGVLAAQADLLVAELARVGDLVADEQALDVRRRHLDQLDRQVEALTHRLDGIAAERRAIPSERAELSLHLVEAEKTAGRADDLARQAELLTARHAAAVEREHLRAEVEGRSAAVGQLTGLELDAREHWLALLDGQLSTRAALLASMLEDGHPCPVCGSAEHPTPATSGDAVVPDDEVSAAQEAAEAAVEAARAARGSLAEAEQALAAVTATSAGLSLDDLTEQQALLDTELGEARAAADRCRSLANQLEALDERATEIDGQLEAAEALLADARDQQVALAASLADDDDRVAQVRGEFASLAERQQQLEAEHRAVVRLAAALDALDQTESTRARAADAAVAEANHRGLGDLDAARAVGLDADALAALDEAIDAHDRAVAETEADLHREELIEAAAQPPVELEPLRLAAAEAERDLELASIAAATARTAATELGRIDREVGLALTELAPAIDEHERIRRLADLACGDDRQVEHRIRLSTYVLSARLEQVAAAASERLSRMSSGRYTIVPTDESRDGRRKGGLGLRVVDAWTSTERDTASLSGGESFFTSLALALGVADVVSAEAGGVRIDTMFIDEGFGSLDDDTLQEVMDVLDGLRAGGRALGIVSHVADLRDRIATQLEVVKGATGSTLRTRQALAAGPAIGISRTSDAA